ncbi:MAG: N-6 DNA methylase, partial [Planctomycetota bacterium]|nr:N-6 DNA methylase [Planctomycetota bacterium]
MAKQDPELRAHKTWLGLLQPVGLVVSPPALIRAQAVLDKNVIELQQRLIALLQRSKEDDNGQSITFIENFPRFAEHVLEWLPEDIAGAPGGPDLSNKLELVLPDYGETLRPTYAVIDGASDEKKPFILVEELPRGTSFDEAGPESKGWHASPEAKFERLLRALEIPIGVLFNGLELRLIYAPRGESSGHVTFPLEAMAEVAGRMVLGAMHMLLSEFRVFSAPDGRRLSDLLHESRKYQVLGALWDLLAGFQAADEVSKRNLIADATREAPEHIYGGLLTVLLRLVFLLYAEDQGLMPKDEVYGRYYSVTGLYERLREDAGRYPDTMDQRFGAWAGLLTLFRLIFDGGGYGGKDTGSFELPARHGQLFNPDEYPFLEGRPFGVPRVMGDRFEAPKVSDGCIYRVLEALLILDVDGVGDRLSYRALDVEQIGSVYEAMMGFEVERASGRSLALRPKDIVFNVDDLLELDGDKRVKWLKEQTLCDLKGKSGVALKKASSAEEVVAALGRRVSPRTPRLLAPGSLFLQPGEERRRSGSHYTPRELTEPIVRTTLRPVLEALGPKPKPEQILTLKVCDPAMGSGAFLVETCRHLAEQLVEAWSVHKSTPDIGAVEPLLHARRLVAQQCLYGVDKNAFAVNLAKLSIWLVTLSRDQAFTFLDHCLKHGDSLVGLTKAQILAFSWEDQKIQYPGTLFQGITSSIGNATTWRHELFLAKEGDYQAKQDAHKLAEESLFEVRLMGDLIIAAFFSAEKSKDRLAKRDEYLEMANKWRGGNVDRGQLTEIVRALREDGRPLPPFHWEIEFSEVFDRGNPGFDAMIGNPP